MTQYSVTLLYDACQTVNVEAEDPQEAIEKAQEQGGVSLCHQCANDIELADVIAEIVYEGEEVVADTSAHAAKTLAFEQLAKAQQQRHQLLAALADVLPMAERFAEKAGPEQRKQVEKARALLAKTEG